MGLSATSLNRRVDIRRAVVSDDGSGGQISTWTTIGTVWAEAISQNGREAVIAGALQGVAAWRITVRWQSDIRVTDQLRLDGRDLNIRTAEDPNGRRERIVIFADTASAEG